MKYKKGLSEIIAYVLLIVISIALASGVFIWLKVLTNTDDSLTCPDDLSLLVKDYFCENKVLTINLTNTGRFSISGFYVWAENNSNISMPLRAVNSPSADGRIYFNPILKPGQKTKILLNYSEVNIINNLKLEPFLIKDKEIALCSKSITNYDISSC